MKCCSGSCGTYTTRPSIVSVHRTYPARLLFCLCAPCLVSFVRRSPLGSFPPLSMLRLPVLPSSAAEGLTDYGESQVFDDDWFGEASPENSLHTVDKGRWAYTPIMKASSSTAVAAGWAGLEWTNLL